MPASEAGFVRARDIARKYDVHERTVLLWAERNKIPCIRFGKTVRFDPGAVAAVVERGMPVIPGDGLRPTEGMPSQASGNNAL